MMEVKCKNPQGVAKQFFWLAWKAAGSPMGMGVFQNRPEATAEQVFANVQTNGDYPGTAVPSDDMRADYVFGRMLKVGIKILPDGVAIRDDNARPDYQAWACAYPTTKGLLDAAIATATTE